MKTCHVCKGECEDNAELCPYCGAELLPEEPCGEDTEAPRDIIIENPVVAASVEDIITAEIFCDMLTEAGIPNTTDTENDSPIHLQFGGGFAGIDVYVPEERLDEAAEIYKKALEESENSSEDFEG